MSDRPDLRGADAPGDTDESESLSGELRLADVLKERMRAERGYSALARAITASVPERERRGRRSKQGEDLIDRRRLKAIVEGKSNVVLSLRELSYLDQYLDRYGEGLSYNPIFRRKALLQTLARTGHVKFLLGTKPDAERQNVSHWDMLAMAEILRNMNAYEVRASFDILDIPLIEPSEAARDEGGVAKLLSESDQSILAVGSGRSNPAAGVMLCKMLGRNPVSASRKEKQDLDLHFVWNDVFWSDAQCAYESPLHLRSGDVAPMHPKQAEFMRKTQASALDIGGELYVDQLSRQDRDPNFGKTYGICAAQRRRRGQLWVVVSGITGVGTYVAGRLLGKLATGLHDPKAGAEVPQRSPVYWGLVSATIPEFSEVPLASQRAFADERIFMQPPIPAS